MNPKDDFLGHGFGPDPAGCDMVPEQVVKEINDNIEALAADHEESCYEDEGEAAYGRED